LRRRDVKVSTISSRELGQGIQSRLNNGRGHGEESPPRADSNMGDEPSTFIVAKSKEAQAVVDRTGWVINRVIREVRSISSRENTLSRNGLESIRSRHLRITTSEVIEVTCDT
jgi:hypothetical protein